MALMQPPGAGHLQGWRVPGRDPGADAHSGKTSTRCASETAGPPRLIPVRFGFCSLLEAQVSVVKSKVTMTQLARQHNPLLGSRNTFPAFISNCKSKQPPTYFLKLISSSLVTLKGFKSDQIVCVCVVTPFLTHQDSGEKVSEVVRTKASSPWTATLSITCKTPLGFPTHSPAPERKRSVMSTADAAPGHLWS